MVLGDASIAELAIAELDGASGGALIIGDLTIDYALLWDLDPDFELYWDLDPEYVLYWDLDPLVYGEDNMPITTSIDIGDTVILTGRAMFDGVQVDSSFFILQIKTPDLIQHPDIPGSEFTFNPVTERYEYLYNIRDEYAQAGVHNFRFRAINTDNNTGAAKWRKLPVGNMPFSET